MSGEGGGTKTREREREKGGRGLRGKSEQEKEKREERRRKEESEKKDDSLSLFPRKLGPSFLGHAGERRGPKHCKRKKKKKNRYLKKGTIHQDSGLWTLTSGH